MATLKADAQTDASEVKEIFETALADAVVNAYINAAVEVRKSIPDFDGFNATREGEIEKYLAAHFLTAQDPRPDREQHESVTVSYEGEHSHYLDIAASLDPTGTIDALADGGGAGSGSSFEVPRAK